MANGQVDPGPYGDNEARGSSVPKWRAVLQRSRAKDNRTSARTPTSGFEEVKQKPEGWTMGILNDKQTDEVPGSILLLSKASDHNEPLGLRNAPARTSASSLPSPYAPSRTGSMLSRRPTTQKKKRTPDGKIILEPQPEESQNDPLNWPAWRRDCALFSLGFYCMLGGGMTPILAAGFNNVASTYRVSVPQVALTTGLYMMGLGIGSVIASPTAIKFGKRPVYLVAALLFVLTSVWCALSPTYSSLVIARIVMGLAVSPVECLPSATVAEIFFLHERAYRLGIYTLLLLGGKNLVPLVSAAIIQSLGWRWVFWVVAMIVGFGFALLFFFVPETFWDRTPRPHKAHNKSRRPTFTGHLSMLSSFGHGSHQQKNPAIPLDGAAESDEKSKSSFQMTTTPGGTLAQRRLRKHAHFGAAADDDDTVPEVLEKPHPAYTRSPSKHDGSEDEPPEIAHPRSWSPVAQHPESWKVQPMGGAPATPKLHNLNSPFYQAKIEADTDYFNLGTPIPPQDVEAAPMPEGTSTVSPKRSSTSKRLLLRSSTVRKSLQMNEPSSTPATQGVVESSITSDSTLSGPLTATKSPINYTSFYRAQPPKSFLQTLKPWSGRLSRDNWFRIAFRPFVLFAYPSVLWSALVYSLSVGWLIVLSESVSSIYRNRASYNFTALQTGLVYLSPFIGGVLGTAVAGKVSDLVVRFMARRNGGIYEPEFRLVMAIPVALTTTIGLMGFGWSAAERDQWIVPTLFFGIISFGCSLGSTTAITFCVDSYRQYAGEALVTLNFSKNILHGLLFSLFFNRWLEADGPKDVFVALGGIQLACLLGTIPVYIYGKRARMWTVRKNLMEKF
ncbi:hypothetical protein B0A49_05496 [Cryomyces minteri]|uniref:Major facilitator superfamily (MFS) profile domain-containing protein n=1 Tax=Cryomyces minteri TaxID=331657 RepID=A0A4U0X0I7_9PEZI|nr:hypothetical protein B0A49_05496 [Cryomyces minteri]